MQGYKGIKQKRVTIFSAYLPIILHIGLLLREKLSVSTENYLTDSVSMST